MQSETMFYVSAKDLCTVRLCFLLGSLQGKVWLKLSLLGLSFLPRWVNTSIPQPTQAHTLAEADRQSRIRQAPAGFNLALFIDA